MKHQKVPHSIETPVFAPFGSQTAPFGDAFGKGASMFGRSFAALQKERMRFMNQCLENNMKAVEEFGACRSLPDVFAAQQRWLAGMAKSYAEEWLRCGEMMTEIARESTDTAEGSSSRPGPDTAH